MFDWFGNIYPDTLSEIKKQRQSIYCLVIIIQHPALPKPRIMSKTLEKSEVSSMASVLELFIKGQIENEMLHLKNT